jgi:hypothetical protein
LFGLEIGLLKLTKRNSKAFKKDAKLFEKGDLFGIKSDKDAE